MTKKRKSIYIWFKPYQLKIKLEIEKREKKNGTMTSKRRYQPTDNNNSSKKFPIQFSKRTETYCLYQLNTFQSKQWFCHILQLRMYTNIIFIFIYMYCMDLGWNLFFFFHFNCICSTMTYTHKSDDVDDDCNAVNELMCMIF